MCRECDGCMLCQDRPSYDLDELERQWEHEADDIEEELMERWQED